jgi:glycosyltransferase involved in cell wall biosynthesis
MKCWPPRLTLTSTPRLSVSKQQQSFQTGFRTLDPAAPGEFSIDAVGQFNQKALMRLSVALCTFNGERFLLEQLESVKRQMRLPDELVVCDDGSNDGTLAIVGRFAEHAGFKISVCVNPTRLGVTQNFARAFSLCSGELIVPCDQDDIWEPEKLALLESAFRADEGLLLAFHDLAVINLEGRLIGGTQWQRLDFATPQKAQVNSGQAFERLLRFNVVTGAAMAFRSSLSARVLPIPDCFVHDEWIALVAAASGRVANIDRPLVRYRQHDGQAIGTTASTLMSQYRHARSKMGRSYFTQMVARTRLLHERLRTHSDALLNPDYLALVEEKLEHAQARLRMRNQTLIRWPLAIGEAVRGRYNRFGYGFKSFLQDLVL